MYPVAPLNRALSSAIQARIDNKTKPLGALGDLETLALRLGQIQLQQVSDPLAICHPTMLVFAGDHGIANAGVSIAPSEVTTQMVLNFVAGGAAINVFCRQLGWQLKVVDCGILAPLDHPQVISQRLGAGTRPFHQVPAMGRAQVEQGFALARELVRAQLADGCNLLAFGEMGIGNTSAAAAIMAALTGLPVAECVGRGTGVDDAIFARKVALISEALALHQPDRHDPVGVLAAVGGFEIVQLTGAILAAAEAGVPVLVDGFIVTVAALCAVRLAPGVRDYLIFAHQSQEQGHRLLLEALDARPLLQLGMRLGEGSGAALALPLLEAAVNFYNQMASFAEAGVDNVVETPRDAARVDG
ncbi:nicotinate-nucleotide--dimethylbenzimidazole phosphoribosyltransferase [Aeromonas sp. MdU4]|uniref:nicotinate-nucleotide--dimethylbenzimidazole phosphoribosyltransferase n=1 Tax=Aeromonas sp. MdU4 TaxID=3342819 RepID=UPI0035B9F66D